MSPQNPTAPVYSPPSKGPLSVLPPSWVPYAELIRLDRIDGFLAFYYPFLIGLCFAATVHHPVASSVESIPATGARLLVAVAFLRFAAVAFNDVMDADLDRRVRRCCLRPIARGAVSPLKGYIVTSVNLAIWFAFVGSLPGPGVLHAAIYTVLNGLYPLSKRVTVYTPVVLGITFTWGMFVSCGAVGLEPTSLFQQGHGLIMAASSISAALIVWVIIFETIYAYQDIKDDEKEGINSLAVSLRGYGKAIFSTLGVVQVCLLGIAGMLLDVGAAYFALTCGGTSLLLAILMWNTDLRKPSDCFWFFKTCIRYVGGSMALGFLGELARSMAVLD